MKRRRGARRLRSAAPPIARIGVIAANTALREASQSRGFAQKWRERRTALTNSREEVKYFVSFRNIASAIGFKLTK